MSGDSGEQKMNSRDRQPGSPKFFSDEELAEFARRMREFSILTELPTESHLFKHSILDRDFESALFQIFEKGFAAESELIDYSSTSREREVQIQRRELQHKVRDGDYARSLLLRSNLRLVKWEARKHLGSGISLDDLIQEGTLGLMHAVEKFDWRKGFKFSTYATWWIRQAITRGIANTGRTIRLPVHAGDTLARLQKARSRLALKFGRKPTLRELASEVEMPEEKVIEVLRFADLPLGIDGFVSTGEPGQSSDPTENDENPYIEFAETLQNRSSESSLERAGTSLLPEEIRRLLAPLDEREREILKFRFGLNGGESRTLEEVGRLFNLTRERIRQIEARAMSKLRMPSQPRIVLNILDNSEPDSLPDT